MILWQSDYPIVSEKSMKVDGEKGIARMRGDIRDTSATLRGGQRMSTKLISLTLRAKKDKKTKFTSLAHLLNEDFLMECFAEIKKNKAPGIDGINLEEYEKNLDTNIKDLVSRLKAKKYKPKPAKRVYIPKPNGDKRPLGIPCCEDKIVQMAIMKILEAIYEVDFLDVSYGFRPNRNCHQALDVLDKTIMTKPINTIVDQDIEKFFDTINHNLLMKCLKQRIADPNFLRIIGRFLNAGIMEEGKYIKQDKGTPQGGIISPILANIYLHYILDIWFEKKIKPKTKGIAQLIRYADDFIVCFQRRTDGEEFAEKLKQRFENAGLKVKEDKSRIIEFGRYAWYKSQKEDKKSATFDFLGFTHYCDKTRGGKFKVGRKTESSKFRQKLKEINLWLKKIRNQVSLKSGGRY